MRKTSCGASRRTGKKTVVVKDYEDKLLNGPNDVWLRPDGGIYFTDPFYKRDYWQRGPMEQDVQGRLLSRARPQNPDPRGSDLTQPNGIIGTPDGKTLYVADIDGNKTYSYTIERDGTLSQQAICSAKSAPTA